MKAVAPLLGLLIVTAAVVINLLVRTAKHHAEDPPKPELAVVIPFVKSEEGKLFSLINRWETFPPCTGQDLVFDVVLYFHRDYVEEREFLNLVLGKLRKRKKKSGWGKCVRRLSVITANLTREEDKYPLGASLMWFKLFELPQFARYKFVYYMETDNQPCRAGWADRLCSYLRQDLIEFWMVGSITRKAKEEVGTYNFANHINGNALYRIGDPQFSRFILQTVKPHFLKDQSAYLESYDIAIYKILNNRSIVSFDYFTSVVHKFVYTDFVQNLYRAFVNGTEYCQKHSSTYLLHGRNVHW